MSEEMSSFFVIRVELHAAERADYEVLHAAMDKAGFTRRISHRGVTYKLPEAEYAIRSDQAGEILLDRTKAAAATTKKVFRVMVNKSAEFYQYNLEET
jgi:hypothetical protein